LGWQKTAVSWHILRSQIICRTRHVAQRTTTRRIVADNLPCKDSRPQNVDVRRDAAFE